MKLLICHIGNISNNHFKRWILSQPLTLTVPFIIDGIFNFTSLDIRLKVKELIALYKCNYIHGHYIGKYGLYAMILSSIFRKRLILTAWGSDVLMNPQKSWIHNLIFKLIISKSILITCDSLEVEQKLRELGYYKNICIVQFGINDDYFTKQKYLLEITHPLRDKKYILSLRNHSKTYNIDKIIDGFNLFLKQKPGIKIKLAIIGNGSMTNDLIRQCKNLGISDKVLFLGFVNMIQQIRLLDNCLAAISISSSDSAFSCSIMECMAREALIITNRFHKNTIDIPKDFRCIEVHDLTPEYVTDSFKSALTINQSIKSDYIQTNKRYAIENFSAKDSMKRFITMLSYTQFE